MYVYILLIHTKSALEFSTNAKNSIIGYHVLINKNKSFYIDLSITFLIKYWALCFPNKNKIIKFFFIFCI